MKKRFKHISFMIVLWMLTVNVSFASQAAALPASEAETIEYLETLNNDREIPPNEMLAILDTIYAYSIEQNWQDAMLLAILDKARSLLYIGSPLEAQKVLREIETSNLSMKTNEQKVRYKLLDLQISDELGEVSSNAQKRADVLKMATLIEDANLLGNLYLTVGQSQHDNDDYVNAIENLKQAYRWFEQTDDSSALGSTLSELGSVSVNIGSIESGIDYFNQALNVTRMLNDKFDESILLYNISHAYYSQDQYELALDYIAQATQISRELDDDIGVTWAQQLTASIYLGLERWQDALDLYQQTSAHFNELGQAVMQFQALIGKARALTELGRLEEAEADIQSASNFLEQVKSDLWMLQYKSAVVRLERAKGNFKAAFDELEAILELKESINTQEQSLQIQRSRIEFDTDLKESQNNALKKELELNDLVIKQQQQLQYVWIALSLIAALLVLSLSVFLYKQIRKRNMFQDLALKDPLTLAPNRRAILQIAALRLQRAENNDYSIGLLDIDNFKKINDQYGHDAGDEVLIAFAKACKMAIRDNDHFGRFGGEEWLIAFENTKPENIKDVFARLREQVNALTKDIFPENKEVTFSMGVASFKADKDKSINDIIKRADTYLYQAKSEGKDRVIIEN